MLLKRLTWSVEEAGSLTSMCPFSYALLLEVVPVLEGQLLGLQLLVMGRLCGLALHQSSMCMLRALSLTLKARTTQYQIRHIQRGTSAQVPMPLRYESTSL